MSDKLYKNALSKLKGRVGNLRCNEVKDLLESLGFEVRDGSRGGHKIFTHDGLPSFFSGSFNCGHGKNPEIKLAYIKKLIGTLESHQTELAQFLSEKK